MGKFEFIDTTTTIKRSSEPNNKTFKNIVLLVVFILLILALGLFGGCKSAEQKQASIFNQLEKVDRKAQKDSVTKHIPAKWSLFKFPLKIGAGKTVYLPGKKIPIPVHDTEYVQIDCDSAIKSLGIGKGKVKIKPRDSVRVDTFYRVDTLIDPRPQAICNAEIKRLQTKISEVDAKLIQSKASEQNAKDKLSKRTAAMWWLIVAVVVLLLWTFRKLFGIIR